MHDNDEVTPTEAHERAAKGSLLLDVREQDEWDRGHVDGSHHIPLGELHSRSSELPTGVEILCICRSGRRSAKAQSLLQTLPHIGSVYNVTGGILRWAQDGLPLIGSPGE